MADAYVIGLTHFVCFNHAVTSVVAVVACCCCLLLLLAVVACQVEIYKAGAGATIGIAFDSEEPKITAVKPGTPARFAPVPGLCVSLSLSLSLSLSR